MLSLQNRIREILLSDPWFQDPVKVFVEDTAGLKFLYSSKLAKIAHPVVLIQTAEGVGDRRPAGTCLLNETLTLIFSECPTFNNTGRTILEGVEAAMQVLHEAILWPEHDAAGQHRVQVAGHGPVDVPGGNMHMHAVDIVMPVQIRPKTPAQQRPMFT